jgi:exosome complex protein LRP1
MSSDTEESSPTGIPPKLCTSINALRDTLDPVLSQTWSSSVDALSALERAKVDIMIAYTLVDLVWGMSASSRYAVAVLGLEW